MHKRGLTVALVAVLTLIFVFGAVGAAFAAEWPDLSLSILGDYGITEQQVANISDGFPDGTWQPYAAMPRKQFVKMAVDAYQIPLVTPATPTYSDVPASNYYYSYIEAATAAGLTNGVGGGKMEPDTIITREQAAAIIVRWVADKNGYDLATMYTAADAAAILAAFPDASAVGPSLVNEMAFAVDFGIVWGDASGKLAPKSNLSRIQGAAMLIRSLDIIPTGVPTEPVVPAKIELVPATADEAENLIGLTHQYTYKATQADGSAAPGVLVDFDTLLAPWYVGNIQPAAALTDANGEVTVNLISTEVGIERVSASAPGVAAIWSTKYWLALDEVYILDDTRSAQNNAGTTHTWEARVLVFGPGPLSTSQSDWYNLYLPAGDPSHPLAADGVDAEEDYNVDYSSYADELDWTADGYVGRSMPDIPVFWQIQNVVADNPATAADESVASVGTIVAAIEDGEIAADGKSAWALTDADGLTSIDITSDVTGQTWVTAEANYVGNPYEWQLFHHQTNNDFEEHFYDFQDQPAEFAWAFKTWIPHVIGSADSPIDPAYTYANLGERKILTITLEDVFGNAITGREVKWFMEGIGRFDTDDERSTSSDTDPNGNLDYDTTNASGQAQVFIESNDAGEQIVHAKVRDKGIDGVEGQFITYDAEVQWFDVNVATFDDPTTVANEALDTNAVGTTHDFTLQVYGLKLEKDDQPWALRQQTPVIDTDAAGHSYDQVFDSRDADYFGGILLVNPSDLSKDPTTGAVITNGVVTRGNPASVTKTVQGVQIHYSLLGGITQFDWDQDGLKDPFTGTTGIYLPLPGKTVTYALSNGTALKSNLGSLFDGAVINAVGSFTPATDVTDANGEATVTVTSNAKGPETIQATVDWADNPHDGPQLIKAYAKKLWTAGGAGADIKVYIDSTQVANTAGVFNKDVVNRVNIAGQADATTNAGLYGMGNISVHVTDQFGNDLPDYEVVYQMVGAGTVTPAGGQDAFPTYHPKAYFDDRDTLNTTASVSYDDNGTRPDSDEPMPADDPYAPVVGPGGTWSFYFNQNAGSDNPFFGDTLPSLPGEFFDGNSGVAYDPTTNAGQDPSTNVLEDLVTDGAKAWTLDGFNRLGESSSIVVNKLTGSNVDLVLAENPLLVLNPATGLPYTHIKSLVKIFVYAPANGLVLGGTPIWSGTIHKVWYVPAVTTVTLSPSSDIAIAGLESTTFTATVLDQAGSPMAGVAVQLFGTVEEGTLTTTPDGTGSFGFTTNAAGQVNFTWSEVLGDWGVQDVWAEATVSGIESNHGNVQWVYRDGSGLLGDLVEAVIGQTKITAYAGFNDWIGKTLQGYLTPGAALLGSVAYDASIDSVIPTSHTWITTDAFYVKATATSDTDEIVNWVYDTTIAAPIMIN